MKINPPHALVRPLSANVDEDIRKPSSLDHLDEGDPSGQPPCLLLYYGSMDKTSFGPTQMVNFYRRNDAALLLLDAAEIPLHKPFNEVKASMASTLVCSDCVPELFAFRVHTHLHIPQSRAGK